MRSVTIGLVLLLPFGAAGATPAIEPAVKTESSRHQERQRLTESEEGRDCPTSYEVRTYIYIEPKTGREYRALNFYCPALDEA